MRRLLLVLPVLFVFVTACGGDERQETLADAFAKTSKESARTSISITFSGLSPDPITMTGEGIVDEPNQRGRVTFDMSELGRALGAPGDLGEMEIVYDRDALYMRLSVLELLDPTAKPWIKVGFDELTEGSLGQLPNPGQFDPNAILTLLEVASEDLEEVGEEEVRGVQTTRYRMTLDFDEVLEEVPEAERQRARGIIDTLVASGGSRSIPIEVWVGEDGFVRRQRYVNRNAEFAPGERGDLTTTIEMFDFGVDAVIEPPPPDQVGSFSEIFGEDF